MLPIGILYEHPEWFQAALRGARSPWTAVREARRRRGSSSTRTDREHAYSLVVNRMSPSAWTRGNERAIFHSLHYLAHLDRIGAPVLNGLGAYELELSKARQASLLGGARRSRIRGRGVVADPSAVRRGGERAGVPRPREAEHRRQRRAGSAPSTRRPELAEATLRPGSRRHAPRPGAATRGGGLRSSASRSCDGDVPLRDPDPAPAGQLQPLPGRLLRAAGSRATASPDDGLPDRGVRATGGGGRGREADRPGCRARPRRGRVSRRRADGRADVLRRQRAVELRRGSAERDRVRPAS